MLINQDTILYNLTTLVLFVFIVISREYHSSCPFSILVYIQTLLKLYMTWTCRYYLKEESLELFGHMGDNNQ